MEKVFEDEFMDLQTALISLCLEVTEEKVNKVYVYCSNEKKSKMFNAFFDVNGEVKRASSKRQKVSGISPCTRACGSCGSSSRSDPNPVRHPRPDHAAHG